MDKIRFNGKWLDANTPLVGAENRGLRYGDGIFETLRLENDRIPFASGHWQRFFSSLELLGLEWPAHLGPLDLENEMRELARKNGHSSLARIRLMAFRGNGGPFDPENNKANYLIQSWALSDVYTRLNENGLVIGIYPEARKSTDIFSRLKSANYLPYLMAARYAKEKGWNEALVLNTENRIADASIANLFFVKNEVIYTPPLEEGPVAGVMRQYLVDHLPEWGYPLVECPVHEKDLLEADSIFLTNAVSGIRWVKEMGGREFGVGIANDLYPRVKAKS